MLSKNVKTGASSWNVMTVLILVLMEYALEVTCNEDMDYTISDVLILVLMEYALEASNLHRKRESHLCLNPCFNGICSRSQINGV